jgi:hypothetical protein
LEVSRIFGLREVLSPQLCSDGHRCIAGRSLVAVRTSAHGSSHIPWESWSHTHGGRLAPVGESKVKFALPVGHTRPKTVGHDGSKTISLQVNRERQLKISSRNFGSHHARRADSPCLDYRNFRKALRFKDGVRCVRIQVVVLGLVAYCVLICIFAKSPGGGLSPAAARALPTLHTPIPAAMATAATNGRRLHWVGILRTLDIAASCLRHCN